MLSSRRFKLCNPHILLAILVCLPCAQLSDTDDSGPAPDNSDGTAPSSVLFAGFGSAWDDLIEDVKQLPGTFLRGFQSNDEAACEKPSNSHSESKPAPENPPHPVHEQSEPMPEDSLELVPKPECLEFNSDYIAVCCFGAPIPLSRSLVSTYSSSLSQWSECNLTFSWLSHLDISDNIILVMEKQVSAFLQIH